MINHILNSNRKSYVTNETDYLLDFSRQINIHFKGIPKKGGYKRRNIKTILCNVIYQALIKLKWIAILMQGFYSHSFPIGSE